MKDRNNYEPTCGLMPAEPLAVSDSHPRQHKISDNQYKIGLTDFDLACNSLITSNSFASLGLNTGIPWDRIVMKHNYERQK
jgi:hypothetical protein